MKKKILPQEGLKLIACITMLIDHFGHAIVPHLPVPDMVELYYACRIVGRLAFPIYCFLLAQGMCHTHNPRRYILRLGVGILLAELPFDLLFDGQITWAHQSVMVTLTLGAVMLLCMGKTEKKWLKLLLTIPFVAMAEFAKCDYGGWGIVMIAVFALFDRSRMQTIGILLVNACMESAMIPVFGIPVSVQLFAAFAMVPIALYSGGKLSRSKTLQWAFYLFYPVHLLLLWIVLGFVR
jgi:hypothetical protein